MISDRETFRSLLIDLLAIRTAQELDELPTPKPETLAKFRSVAAPRADEVLRRYELGLYASEISSAVVSQVGTSLKRRVRFGKSMEIGFAVSLFVEGALIGASAFILDPTHNAQVIKDAYYALLAVVVVQFGISLYFLIFD
jgi:hypothetical protein